MARAGQPWLQHAYQNNKRIRGARYRLRPGLKFVGAVANMPDTGETAPERMQQRNGQPLQTLKLTGYCAVQILRLLD